MKPSIHGWLKAGIVRHGELMSLSIGLLSQEYPPHVRGGAGSYAHNLAREVTALGHSVHVITPARGKDKLYEVADDVFIHRISSGLGKLSVALDYWLALRLRLPAISRSVGGFDVIHENGLVDLPWRKPIPDATRVLTVHHTVGKALEVLRPGPVKRLRSFRDETGFMALLEPRIVSRATSVIAVSGDTKQDVIRRFNVPEDRVTAIYNGANTVPIVPQERIADVRARLGVCNGAKIVLFVGRLEPRKGVDVLLGAFAASELRCKDAKLVLAGAGQGRTFLQLAHELGIADQVEFLGYVEDDLLWALYRAADIFVLPSRHEGFGLVALEAATAGCRLVLSSAGALPELAALVGPSARLFTSGNTAALARALDDAATDDLSVLATGPKSLNWGKTAAETVQHYKTTLLRNGQIQ